MGNLKIRDVRVIVTQPTANLVVVKVETDEPELYGLGCATYTQRAQQLSRRRLTTTSVRFSSGKIQPQSKTSNTLSPPRSLK